MKTFDEETLQKIATLAFSIHARAGQCEAEASVTMPGTHAHRSFQDSRCGGEAAALGRFAPGDDP